MTTQPNAGGDQPPEPYYGSTDEFVREYLRHVYKRKIDGSRTCWSPEWWRSAEAVARLESLWRAWEHLRLDPATGPSVWWRDHADPHMAVLLSSDGPFGKEPTSPPPSETRCPTLRRRQDCSPTSEPGRLSPDHAGQRRTLSSDAEEAETGDGFVRQFVGGDWDDQQMAVTGEDHSELRKLIGDAVGGLYSTYRHDDLPDRCRQLGLPAPPPREIAEGSKERSKADRLAASCEAVDDTDLVSVAANLLAYVAVPTPKRWEIENALWDQQTSVERSLWSRSAEDLRAEIADQQSATLAAHLLGDDRLAAYDAAVMIRDNLAPRRGGAGSTGT